MVSMRTEQHRQFIISELQQAIHQARKENKPLSLKYKKGHSNTTRSKSYKVGCAPLCCGDLNQILSIDPKNKRIRVEPRVTMEALVQATLPYGLMPAIVPEFKGITVGGAIMGAAAESASQRFGIFHDGCTAIELLDGAGTPLLASPTENTDLFYGVSGSYGTLGLLTAAEIQLIPSAHSVKLRYHLFNDPDRAMHKLIQLVDRVDFLDGVLFNKDHQLVIEGHRCDSESTASKYPWYASHIKELPDGYEEIVPLSHYFFRYDQGAFWMGRFLLSIPFLKGYINQGLLGRHSQTHYFSESELNLFNAIPFPKKMASLLTLPFMSSQQLWRLLHKAGKWVQDRAIIQDCCIPTPQAPSFLNHILKDPATFPIWLCPIKGTTTPQCLAPHLGAPSLINFGIYGLPAYAAPMNEIISRLEKQTADHGGRKVLYSRSFYSEKGFWDIYSQADYERLRQKTHANGMWPSLTEKVLSE